MMSDAEIQSIMSMAVKDPNAPMLGYWKYVIKTFRDPRCTDELMTEFIRKTNSHTLASGALYARKGILARDVDDYINKICPGKTFEY